MLGINMALIIKLDTVTLSIIRPTLRPNPRNSVKWTQNNRNEIAELTRRGMDVETGLDTARKLNKYANQYSLKGISLKDDVIALLKIEKKLDKALETYDKIKKQLTGRNSRNLSKSKKIFLQSELETAKDTVDYLKKEYKSKSKCINSDSYNFGVLDIAIVTNFNKLNRLVPSVSKAHASRSIKKTKRSKSRKTASRRNSRSRR